MTIKKFDFALHCLLGDRGLILKVICAAIRFLAESQGGQDWRTLRNFAMTSTVFLELLSALKQIELEDDAVRADLEYSCCV